MQPQTRSESARCRDVRSSPQEAVFSVALLLGGRLIDGVVAPVVLAIDDGRVAAGAVGAVD
jgi:hypothetical protein